ncbi:hypothetical protein [Streptomyces sp. NPDC050528]|uniref:hypothetical protein n=1 Tax=unclassified Streptomyces TaxID=2593676 RepID=UPI0037B4249E
MTEPITVSTFFPEILRSVPEFERCVTRERENAEQSGGDPEDLDHMKLNPYSLAFDLFTAIIVPALESPDTEGAEDLLIRSFDLLERAAVSPEAYVRDNISLATEDFLLGDLGPIAYAHAGPAFRALMTECMTAEGDEIPESWRA